MVAASNRSLSQAFLLSLALLATTPVLVVGWLWLSDQQHNFEQQSQAWREAAMETRRRFLQQHVLNAIDFIEYKKAQVDRRLRQKLRVRVEEGMALASTLRRREERRGESLHQMLEELPGRDSNIHYFLLRNDGWVVMDPAHPAWQGRVALEERDASGLALVSRLLELAAAGGGYLAHWAPKPGMPGDEFRSLSYVQPLPDQGLVLGVTGYLDDAVAEVKSEVIERLSSMPSDEDSAILFVTSYDGRQLVNAYQRELRGRQLNQVEDAAGQPVFERQLAAVGRPGGEFLNFQWRRRDSDQTVKTLAYVRGYDEWRWIIGAGMFTDRLEAVLVAQRENLRERMMGHISYIVLVVAGLLALVMLVAVRLTQRVRRGFQTLVDFFATASRRVEPIDTERLPYREFSGLAQSANQMIAARRRYEQELKLNEQRFQLALDASRNHLWDVDLRRGEMSFSPGFYRYLGFDGVGQSHRFDVILALCHPDEREGVEQAVAGLRRHLLSAGLEFRLRNRDGVYRWFYCRGDVVETDAKGRSLRALGTITDITARKRMEQDLVAARIAAEDANHAKSLFLSSISHELRTPLNGVLGYAQILLRDPAASEEQRESLEAIEHCGQHLLTLIDDVLDLAKIESGTLEVIRRPCDIKALLLGVADIIRQRAESKGLVFTLKLAEDLPSVIEVDEVKLRQVLVNLLGNAVKFTAEGWVELAVQPLGDGRELLFQVTDTGIGIAPEALGEIFQPFRQVSNDSGGTGLGLAISLRLCEAMGGDLSVESTPGEGSCFSFNIPLVSVESPQPVVAEDSRKLPQLALDGRELAVLVVDDNATNRHVLAAMLRTSGLLVWEAENGAEALALLRHQPISLVLMDVRMPVMDGFTATRAIKTDPALKHIVVIAVTASVLPEVQQRMLEAGCDDFIGKPVRAAELLTKISRHLRLGMESEESPAALCARLPQTMRERLATGVQLGAVDEVEDILAEISRMGDSQQPLLAALHRMLANFEFAEIAAMLKDAEQHIAST